MCESKNTHAATNKKEKTLVWGVMGGDGQCCFFPPSPTKYCSDLFKSYFYSTSYEKLFIYLPSIQHFNSISNFEVSDKALKNE